MNFMNIGGMGLIPVLVIVGAVGYFYMKKKGGKSQMARGRIKRPKPVVKEKKSKSDDKPNEKTTK